MEDLRSINSKPGAFYVMDHSYLDFERLHLFTDLLAFFVIRAKKNLKYRRVYSHDVDRTTGLQLDQASQLLTPSLKGYPDKLRRVKYFDTEKKNVWSF